MEQQPAPGTTFAKKREGSVPSKVKNCAECRRLKIRCDRQVPCNNCVKRGTASICPDGQLMAKGHRLILSNTEDLHAKIEELTTRIHQLEEALAALQAQHSQDPHPLLAAPDDEPPITSFGSLMIGEDGNSRFYGGTSSVEWMMLMDRDNPAEPGRTVVEPHNPVSLAPHPLQVVPDLAFINSEFPLMVSQDLIDIQELKRMLVTELPERELATMFVDNYYGRAAWEMAPVLRTRFVSEYFAPCYADPERPAITMHELAFVYAVFGLGTLHSFEIQDHLALSHRYISLSRACLTLDSPYINTTITSIDTFLLHVAYTYMRDDVYAPARAWATLGVAMKLAQTIGLHREPSMWGLPEKEVVRRRRTMWELVSCDLWAALISGRPPMISRQHFDVTLPFESPDVADPDPNFSLGKHHFSDACLWQVLDLGLASANKATYASVLKVDTKIRQWRLPKEMRHQGYEPQEEQKTLVNFRNATEMIFREVTLMCLHRCYFAAALLDPQFDLLKSHYSRSVLSIYASSCAILGRVRTLYALEPVLIMKFALFWTHSFSAAIILGSIATRAPDCSLAATALAEFELALEMFTSAQGLGNRAKRGLPTLLHLQKSAHAAMDSFKRDTWSRQDGADSALLRSMGGAGAVLHRHAPMEPGPQPSIGGTQEREEAQTSFEDYLRQFEFHANPSQNQGGYPPSSDEFLQGILSGNWGELFPPDSAENTGSYPASHNSNLRGDISSAASNVAFEQQDTLQVPGAYRPSSPPHSDGGTSGHSGVVPSTFARGIDPPVSLVHPGPGGATHPNAVGEEQRRAFLWDNFLREMGINNI